MAFSEQRQTEDIHFPRIQKEAFGLYLTSFIRSFALSLPGIFVPVFIFEHAGKPILLENATVNGILWIALYYLVLTLFSSLGNLFLTNFVFLRLGFKKAILFGLVALMLGVAGLVFSEQNFLLILLAASFFGLSVHFYWMPFHVFFVRKANEGGNFGEESALRLLVESLAAAAGPIISALIIRFSGFDLLFLLTLVILGLASIPVFLLVQDKKHDQHDVAALFRAYWQDAEKRRLSVGLAGVSTEAILFEIFWPILLYLLLQDVVQMGALITFSSVLSLFVMLWAGRIFEKRQNHGIFAYSVLVNAFLHLMRVFATTPLFLYVIDISDRTNGKIASVGLTSRVYDLAQTYGASDFLIFREAFVHLAQVLILLVAIIILVSGLNWRWVFVLAASCAVLPVLLFSKKSA